MPRKRRQVVETLKGRGQILRGDAEIAEVNYALDVIQQYVDASTLTGPDEVEGMKEIRGQITVLEGERNLSTGESLTLVLEDARHWEFFAKSGDPVSGRYLVTTTGSGLVASN